MVPNDVNVPLCASAYDIEPLPKPVERLPLLNVHSYDAAAAGPTTRSVPTAERHIRVVIEGEVLVVLMVGRGFGVGC